MSNFVATKHSLEGSPDYWKIVLSAEDVRTLAPKLYMFTPKDGPLVLIAMDERTKDRVLALSPSNWSNLLTNQFRIYNVIFDDICRRHTSEGDVYNLGFAANRLDLQPYFPEIPAFKGSIIIDARGDLTIERKDFSLAYTIRKPASRGDLVCKIGVGIKAASIPQKIVPKQPKTGPAAPMVSDFTANVLESVRAPFVGQIQHVIDNIENTDPVIRLMFVAHIPQIGTDHPHVRGIKCIAKAKRCTVVLQFDDGFEYTGNAITGLVTTHFTAQDALAGQPVSALIANPAFEGMTITQVTYAKIWVRDAAIQHYAATIHVDTPKTRKLTEVQTGSTAGPFREAELTAVADAFSATYDTIDPLIAYALDRLTPDERCFAYADLLVAPVAGKLTSPRLMFGGKPMLMSGTRRLRARIEISPGITWEEYELLIEEDAIPDMLQQAIRSGYLGKPVCTLIDHPVFAGATVTMIVRKKNRLDKWTLCIKTSLKEVPVATPETLALAA